MPAVMTEGLPTNVDTSRTNIFFIKILSKQIMLTPPICTDQSVTIKIISRFSDVEAFAKVQYSAPMHEEQDEF